ncbi:MAG: NADH-quinone oxidoreductase subunit L [Verrucomicrobiota bacterium]
MSPIVKYLWLIPVLPLLAAGVIAVMRRQERFVAATLSIVTMGLSCLVSLCAMAVTLRGDGKEAFREVVNFPWVEIGESSVQLGWLLDPLTAMMLVMVTFVGLLIFIYSVGYMAHDENFTRFFCFLSLFAAAMLGLVIANSLLLLFISWELVGLASYLLIGFWFHKPSAAAAAKKAFITTRIGDVGFFLGILWLYSETGTLLFYDHGAGCLEKDALTKLVTQTTFIGMAASTGIALLIFCGAIGKSGQLPLHVWLPDAMEGPTPVSALIHAATMVAAGVFLVARVYPLMDADPAGAAGQSTALSVVTWIGALTAVLAASIAVGQNDIKRILAYSTVSQLGYMMMGLGVGGVAVGMFHLITHAFFKALLFLGSGSVIHGCHEEQDIRRMGGLQKYMPVTFATYAVGMLALAGVPLVFSGFWSKDEILHSAWGWKESKLPFVLGAIGAFLTAFYMTRQMCYVFFGKYRGGHNEGHGHGASAREPHESPAVMTVPLVILAVFAVALGFLGTPVWPVFQGYLNGKPVEAHWGHLAEGGFIALLALSAVVVGGGLFLGWRLYGARGIKSAEESDVLEQAQPSLFAVLRGKLFVDELYEATVIRFNAWWAGVCAWMDRWVWEGVVIAVSYVFIGISFASRIFDEYVINVLFDQGCERVRKGGQAMSGAQDGQAQNYLRAVALALTLFVLLLSWGCSGS